MTTRPSFFAPEHAAAFEDPDVVREYAFRAPYPPATFDLLARLIDRDRPVVLDLGAGTGPIARAIASRADRVDAIDPSNAMLAEGRRLDGDSHRNIRWLPGRAETVELDPPYGLATAGSSLHWMDWDTMLPRLARTLTPKAFFAVLDVDDRHAPWHERLVALFQEYSVYGKTWREFDVIAELERRGLFAVVGREQVPMQFAQPLEAYVRALHSHSSLARVRIGATRAAAFDDGVRKLVALDADGLVRRSIAADVVWGRPLA
ncbi:MAG TPA: class I SAM-dependent methyltransferase [Candidatus Limnocylindria bacterium]